MMKLNILLACAKSLIYIINNRGPRIELCGMPVVIGIGLILYDQFQYIVYSYLGSY